MRMASYDQHRRLVRELCAFADALATESQQFHHLASLKAKPRRLADYRDQSFEWIQHATRSIIMATIAMRNANDKRNTSDPHDTPGT